MTSHKIDSENVKKNAIAVFNAIFKDDDSVSIQGIYYQILKTSRSKVRYVNIEGLTFIEQNPHKDSWWAKLAQEGHQIMWVMQGRRYIAQVKDGTFSDLRKK